MPATTTTRPSRARCPRPRWTGDGGTSRPVVYGHGLLGSRGEVENSQVAKLRVDERHDLLRHRLDRHEHRRHRATHWRSSRTCSKFPTLADRSQQGILNATLLGRLMIGTTTGLSAPTRRSRPRRRAGPRHQRRCTSTATRQGSIMGGAATAISPDWTRATLGVAGMNYALLLQPVDRLHHVLRRHPRHRLSRPCRPADRVRPVLQMLWDRAETERLRHPPRRRPAARARPSKQVLLHVAFGDHQVAQVVGRDRGAHDRRPHPPARSGRRSTSRRGAVLRLAAAARSAVGRQRDRLLGLGHAGAAAVQHHARVEPRVDRDLWRR